MENWFPSHRFMRRFYAFSGAEQVFFVASLRGGPRTVRLPHLAEQRCNVWGQNRVGGGRSAAQLAGTTQTTATAESGKTRGIPLNSSRRFEEGLLKPRTTNEQSAAKFAIKPPFGYERLQSWLCIGTRAAANFGLADSKVLRPKRDKPSFVRQIEQRTSPA